MKNRILFTFLTLLVVTFSACKRGKYWKVRDLTAEKTFTASIEGPAALGAGTLYVANYQKNGTIAIVDSLGKAELFETLPNGGIASGIRFDKDWNMYIADQKNHCILIMRSGEKTFSVYARDSAMTQPNDLAITETGIIFATDPDTLKATGSIYRSVREGELVKIDSGLGAVNGIEVSPGDKFLYVSETNTRKIWRYNLDSTGNISNKKLFFEMPDSWPDGMRCDTLGNLYVCLYNKGVVAVVSPEGKIIREVETKGKKVSNISFGGSDGKTCFLTVQERGCVEVFRAETPGREWTFFQVK